VSENLWKIVVTANGGLGNRLRTLASAYYIADRFGFPLLVCWMPDRFCECDFHDLFDDDIELVAKPEHSSRKAFYEQLLDGPIHYYGKDAARDPELASMAMMPRRETDLRNDGHVVFDCVEFLEFIDRPTRTQLLHRLKIKGDILASAQEFCARHGIDKQTYGVHIRRTDHSKKSDSYFVSRMNAIVWKDPAARFFVCSDSKEAEDDIVRRYPGRVVTRAKKSYVRKHDNNLDWLIRISDDEAYYNVSRDRQSVIDALEDLIVLSRTKFSIKSNGSFSEIVELLDPEFERTSRAWDEYGSDCRGPRAFIRRLRPFFNQWIRTRF